MLVTDNSLIWMVNRREVHDEATRGMANQVGAGLTAGTDDRHDVVNQLLQSMRSLHPIDTS